MPKFKKPNEYSKPSEAAVIEPEETPIAEEKMEAAVSEPKEKPVAQPSNICGIGGCTTRYDDPAMMKKHKLRQHGVGVINRNRPEPRDANVKMA